MSLSVFSQLAAPSEQLVVGGDINFVLNANTDSSPLGGASRLGNRRSPDGAAVS